MKSFRTSLVPKLAFLVAFFTCLGAHAQQSLLTKSDVAIAKQVIDENTMTIPGFGVGTQVKVSSGEFCTTDALVLYLLKFHQKYQVCPPLQIVAELLERIEDSDFHKKAVSLFWFDYSTSSDINDDLQKSTFLKDNFEWYILTKQTEKMKISNARLQGFVGADQAWRKAMDAQQRYWEKSTEREQEYILKRDAYRVSLDAQKIIWEAEQAVKEVHE